MSLSHFFSFSLSFIKTATLLTSAVESIQVEVIVRGTPDAGGTKAHVLLTREEAHRVESTARRTAVLELENERSKELSIFRVPGKISANLHKLSRGETYTERHTHTRLVCVVPIRL